MADLKYYDIIQKPIITEKSMTAMEEKKYTFAVHTEATKAQIKEAVEKLLNMVPSKYNGLTLCTGSLGASPDNDMVEIIKAAGNRIYFAHLRNVSINDRWFNETAHESDCGSLDMYEIVKALQEVGFDGYVRPDHGRMIWGEVARPSYGLYDRALGVSYLNGLWEAVEKSRKEK